MKLQHRLLLGHQTALTLVEAYIPKKTKNSDLIVEFGIQLLKTMEPILFYTSALGDIIRRNF